MNFVSHYFLDRFHPESSFAVGAATPDLLSIYNPSLRIKAHHISRLDPDELKGADIALIDGIQRHFDADAVFHSSDFFKAETAYISKALKERLSHTEVPRKYFIAHILLELILDKALIEDHPGLLEEYYNHYRNTVPFLEIRHTTELVAGKRLPNYEQFLQKFYQNRYLFQYREWDHIAFVLKKILIRVGIHERSFLEEKAFILLMEDYQDHLHEQYGGLFDLLEKDMKLRENGTQKA